MTEKPSARRSKTIAVPGPSTIARSLAFLFESEPYVSHTFTLPAQSATSQSRAKVGLPRKHARAPAATFQTPLAVCTLPCSRRRGIRPVATGRNKRRGVAKQAVRPSMGAGKDQLGTVLALLRKKRSSCDWKLQATDTERPPSAVFGQNGFQACSLIGSGGLTPTPSPFRPAGWPWRGLISPLLWVMSSRQSGGNAVTALASDSRPMRV
jgi:hypothetical protein